MKKASTGSPNAYKNKNTELERENDHLLRKLTEFKVSNQDKLHSTMIKNILSVGAWNRYQGSQQDKGKESR